MKLLHLFVAWALGLSDRAKALLDTVSIGTMLGTLLNSLPHIAAGLSVVWGAIRIYETKTVQDWLRRRQTKAMAKAAAKAKVRA